MPIQGAVRYVITGVLIGVAGTAAGPQGPSGSDSSQTCADRWSPEVGLHTSAGQPVYVERPSSALRVRGGIALIGEPTYIWAARDTFVDQAHPERSSFLVSDKRGIDSVPIGALISLSGIAVPIGRPAGVRRMVSPRLVRLTSDRALVIWGSVPEGFPDSSSLVGAVWSAEFDGTSWTTPQRLFAADVVSWSHESAAALAVGDAHVVVPAVDRSAVWVGIVYARYHAGKWSTRRFDTKALPPNVLTLAAGPHGELVMAYVGLTTGEASRAAMLVRRSPDGGTTWGALDVLQILPPNSGSWLTSASTREAMHLFWATDRTPQGGGLRVEHFRSTDARQWAEAATRDLPRMMDLTVIPGRHDVVHLVSRSGPSPAIVATTFRAGRWTAIDSVSREIAASVPTLSASDDSTLIMLWGVARRPLPTGGPPVPVPVSMMSSRRGSCPPQ